VAVTSRLPSGIVEGSSTWVSMKDGESFSFIAFLGEGEVIYGVRTCGLMLRIDCFDCGEIRYTGCDETKPVRNFSTLVVVTDKALSR
jgi:hypothetical protein